MAATALAAAASSCVDSHGAVSRPRSTRATQAGGSAAGSTALRNAPTTRKRPPATPSVNSPTASVASRLTASTRGE